MKEFLCYVHKKSFSGAKQPFTEVTVDLKQQVLHHSNVFKREKRTRPEKGKQLLMFRTYETVCMSYSMLLLFFATLFFPWNYFFIDFHPITTKKTNEGFILRVFTLILFKNTLMQFSYQNTLRKGCKSEGIMNAWFF